MADIRSAVWDHKYPTWRGRVEGLFGNQQPSPEELSKWKATWIAGPNTMPFDVDRDVVFRRTKFLGIHPYFWQISRRELLLPPARWGDGIVQKRSTYQNFVVFYFDEDFYMYKLKHA